MCPGLADPGEGGQGVAMLFSGAKHTYVLLHRPRQGHRARMQHPRISSLLGMFGVIGGEGEDRELRGAVLMELVTQASLLVFLLLR